ncbi:MAG: SDR family oxidoreductase [Bacteroidaceae bacterium]|nr:SDR family oxidoreductase [Bacteroidaceae bacterium]
MKRALVVGGSNGIGLAIALCLSEEYDVTVIDKVAPEARWADRFRFEQFDLTCEDYSLFDRHLDTDVLMITAGFGHFELFDSIGEETIDTYFRVNTIGVMRIIKRFYSRLSSPDCFRCGVMSSIAGYMSSPFLSVYSATKAALRIFIESVNVELERAGSPNCILCVAPGSIKGTHFNGGQHNDTEATMPLARDIVGHLLSGDDLFIPQYDEVYAHVLERYHQDFRAEGRHSYDYKVERLRSQKQA